MSVKRFFKALVCAIAITSQLIPADANAAIGGTWRAHQAFDQAVSKIIDSPRYTYLLTHARSIRTDSSPYDVPTPVLFRIDKNESSPEWEPMCNGFDLSGSYIDDAIYISSGTFLLVAFDNGAIDMIYDDGRIVRIDDMVTRTGTEDNTVNQLTPDPTQKRVYAATKCGYFIIDTDKACVEKVVKLGYNVTWITRCDEYLVMLNDDMTLLRGAADKADSPDDFTPFVFDTFPGTARWINNGQPIGVENLMPLTDTAFTFIARGVNSQQYVLCIARKSPDNKWETGQIAPTATGESRIESYYAYWRYKTPFYYFTVPNRNGYMMVIGNSYTQIDKVAARSHARDDWDSFCNSITSVIKRGSTPTNAMMASWDFKNFIQYIPRASLTALTVTDPGDDAVWTETRDFGRPNAPLAGITNSVSYIPGYGIATSSFGYTRIFGGVNPYVPANLSYYRNGKWTLVSPQLNPPEWAATTSSPYYSAFRSAIENYPTNNPSGLTPDPDTPGFLYTGSITHGITRYNLADPDANILRMSHPKDNMASLPGHVSICPTAKGWSAVCSFSEPKFDLNGTLWTVHNNIDNSPTAFEVWYWTREARLASENANNDPTAFSEWKSIKVPVNMPVAHHHLLHPVNVPGAESLLMFSGNTATLPWVIYDHNNTIDDTSDDRYVVLNYLQQKVGGALTTGNYSEIFSDPETSRVWMAGSNGLILMDPTGGIDNISFEVPKFRFRDEPFRYESFFENTHTTTIDRDASGRKWIGTIGLGLAVVSADGLTIEDVFNTANSPLPSNVIYGVACDHETGIVMISTERGLMEFIPGGAHHSAGGFVPKVFPEVVLPSNPTPVTFTGLPSGCDIVIKDSTGKIVRNLGNSTSGTIIWDTLDTNGDRCATDTYTLHAGDNPESLASIKYLK